MKKISSIQVVVIGFLAIIALGTILLCLPAATRDGQSTSFVNALFTATSATCVTGFVAYDTFTHWSIFGQVTILGLIQIGGLGFMSIATLLSLVFRRKISLKERGIIQEAMNMPEIAGVVRLMKHVLYGTFIFEAFGAVLLSFRFCPEMGMAKGIYSSVFHSVSAFCNAGFDLSGMYAPNTSIMKYGSDLYVNIIIMSLIVIGGIGFYVWEDIYQNGFNLKKYKLHSKMVLSATAVLIFVPAVLFFLLERNNAYSGMSGPHAALSAVFQSVTLRTAGFSTVAPSSLCDSSALLACVLMLVGGSPGSTAGGIKTTSLFVLVLGVISMMKKKSTITVFKRSLPHGILTRVSSILSIYLFFALMSVGVICAVNATHLKETAFEVFSAIGTVGVDMMDTGKMMSVSKLILAFLMFFGRIGGLSLALAFAKPFKTGATKLPTEKISVG